MDPGFRRGAERGRGRGNPRGAIASFGWRWPLASLMLRPVAPRRARRHAPNAAPIARRARAPTLADGPPRMAAAAPPRRGVEQLVPVLRRSARRAAAAHRGAGTGRAGGARAARRPRRDRPSTADRLA